MRKTLATAVATALITAASVAVTSVPANASSFNFSLGLWGPFGGHTYFGPVHPAPTGSGQAHVNYCYAHYPNRYNPHTNTWVSNWGVTKVCYSPHWPV